MFEALADYLVHGLLGLDPLSPTGAALHFFVMDVTKIFALLVVIIYVMGLLRAFLSPEQIREFVRGRNRFGNLFVAGRTGRHGEWLSLWEPSPRFVPALPCRSSSVSWRLEFLWV